MDTVTYPDPQVQTILNDSFVCYTVDESRLSSSDRRLLRRSRISWSPALLFLEPRGGELRRTFGFRPPGEFLIELALALGMHAMLHRELDAAIRHFDRVAHSAPVDELAAEAIFWGAIARFRASNRNYDILAEGWRPLGDRYAHTSWRSRADVWDATPTGRRGHSVRDGKR